MRSGQERLRAMEAQRCELTAAIKDLRAQLDWGAQVLAERGVSVKAAE